MLVNIDILFLFLFSTNLAKNLCGCC